MTPLSLSLLGLIALLGIAIVIVKSMKSRPLVQQISTSGNPSSMGGTANLPMDVGSPYKLAKWRHGWMLVNPNDRYLGQAILEYGECCEYEDRFLHLLLQYRPGKVIEAGSNIGVHTVTLAKTLATQQRELIAFEPQPVIFQNLCANLALNGINNVGAWPFACGAEGGTVYFPSPNYEVAGNFGEISMQAERLSNGVAVPCVRLDDLFGDDQISLIKIDVEGFELQTLQGAVNILSKSRPALYVENDRVEKSQALIEWLWSQNYQLWWHIPALYNPDNFLGNKTDIYPTVCSFNMLGMPRELNIPVAGIPEILSSTDHPLKRPST